MRYQPKDCLFPHFFYDESPWVWLYHSIGPNLFRKFQKKFGNRRVLIPKHGCPIPCSYCPMRTRCIRILRSGGMKPAQIGLRFGLSEKRVYSLLQKS